VVRAHAEEPAFTGETLFKIYWTEADGTPCSQEEDDVVIALNVVKEKRDAGHTFVTMASMDVNSVGKPGVDAVEGGKTPDGHDYTWSKAGRAGKVRRGR
jgi:hypothetical protein